MNTNTNAERPSRDEPGKMAWIEIERDLVKCGAPENVREAIYNVVSELGELRIASAFAIGVLQVITLSPYSFKLDGVKEAIKRLTETMKGTA